MVFSIPGHFQGATYAWVCWGRGLAESQLPLSLLLPSPVP